MFQREKWNRPENSWVRKIVVNKIAIHSIYPDISGEKCFYLLSRVVKQFNEICEMMYRLIVINDAVFFKLLITFRNRTLSVVASR